MIPSVKNRLLTRLLLTIGISLCIASPATAGEVNLSAAASLREAVTELADFFAKAHPTVTST
ncbi:MAG: molybdate ABC transporter substrate-binding protein, partial [Proteobacteria bacterium]|nr:molybdate ABC transporter substrate-binding protein [Pseudomonadota bacterium]